MIKYYLQNKSYYDGNIMNWWAKGRNGYTANLDNAHQFTAEELAEMSLRPTDVAWLCSYIDGKTSRCVNASYCNHDEMKEQESMLLNKSNNHGWISVDDKDNPPPIHQNVLIYINNDMVVHELGLSDNIAIAKLVIDDGDDDSYKYWYTAERCGGDYNISFPIEIKFENVDYWKHLPTPPQE